MTGVEWIYLAAVAISSGIGAYSSYQSGKAAEEQAQSQANIAAMNQKALAEQADSEATNIRSKYRRVRGSQRANAAASGITLDGSLSDVMLDTNFQEDLDIMSVLYQGKQAILSESLKEKLYISQGKNARISGNLGAAASLIGGVAQGVGNYPTISDAPA